jgi:hypothetical protein
MHQSGFVTIVLWIVLAAQQRPSADALALAQVAVYALPYALELLLVCFSTGLAPRLFPMHDASAFVDESNSLTCAAAVACNTATLLALQAASRLRIPRIGVGRRTATGTAASSAAVAMAMARRQWLPWVLAFQTVVLAGVCAWGLSGAAVGPWARAAQLGTLCMSVAVYARAYHDHAMAKAKAAAAVAAASAAAKAAGAKTKAAAAAAAALGTAASTAAAAAAAAAAVTAH